MPELPEVETVLRGLEKNCRGRTLSEVRVLHPLVVKHSAGPFSRRLERQTIESISRHGKALFLQCAAGPTLRIHLGMTGQLLFESNQKKPDAYTRVLFLFTDEGPSLHYRDIRQFGKLSLVPEAREKSWGPDAWKANSDEIVEALKKKRGMLKHALLNQTVIAGLGNIYVDESLHAAQLHPRRRIESLSSQKLADLTGIFKRILGQSIELGGTSFRDYVDTTGRRGGFKGWLHVYGKQGSACPACQTKIRKIVVASRGTHFCPRCQKPPRQSK